MTDIKKTFSMVYPLEAPIGWHLKAAEHLHTAEGTHWVPEQSEYGPWLVAFRRNVRDDSSAVCAKGHTLDEAWSKAKDLAEKSGGE